MIHASAILTLLLAMATLFACLAQAGLSLGIETAICLESPIKCADSFGRYRATLDFGEDFFGAIGPDDHPDPIGPVSRQTVLTYINVRFGSRLCKNAEAAEILPAHWWEDLMKRFYTAWGQSGHNAVRGNP